jgi:hypothetical protein
MYSTPAALSCATNSAPPVPCTSRIAAADARVTGASDCATALLATALRPSPLNPAISCRRDIPLSRYCLMRSFMQSSL